MKSCPHCGQPIQIWRLFRSSTHYECPHCRGVSKIDLGRQFLCVLAGPMTLLALGLGVLIHFDVQSWVARLLFLPPLAFVAALSRDFLNASFGEFRPVKAKSGDE